MAHIIRRSLRQTPAAHASLTICISDPTKSSGTVTTEDASA